MAKNPGDVALNVSIPPDLAARLEALRRRTGRAVRAEVIAALERHLATPPEMTTPPLPPAEPIPASVPKPSQPPEIVKIPVPEPKAKKRGKDRG